MNSKEGKTSGLIQKKRQKTLQTGFKGAALAQERSDTSLNLYATDCRLRLAVLSVLYSIALRLARAKGRRRVMRGGLIWRLRRLAVAILSTRLPYQNSGLTFG